MSILLSLICLPAPFFGVVGEGKASNAIFTAQTLMVGGGGKYVILQVRHCRPHRQWGVCRPWPRKGVYTQGASVWLYPSAFSRISLLSDSKLNVSL